MVEARATTALKAATVASAAFAAGPRRRRRHSRCQRGDTAHCREALARGMNILHIPRRATGGGNEPREERGRSASCLNGCVERRRRGRGGASGPRRLALSGKRACTVVDVSARLVMPDAPVRREVGVRSRCEACRGDGGEPCGGVAGGRGGSAAGRDLRRLLSSSSFGSANEVDDHSLSRRSRALRRGGVSEG